MYRIQNELMKLRDPKYAAFTAKLIPNIDSERIIGVRSPILKQYARDLQKSSDLPAFLDELPHLYLEENHLHAFLLNREKDLSVLRSRLDAFLPHVDNWATCDTLNPLALAKDPAYCRVYALSLLSSSHVYSVRFGIALLMRHFLDERFDPAILDRIADVRSEEYYVKMMIAWYFATALAKQYTAVLPYISEHRLDDWCHRKTIQKAVESYRLSDAQKTELKAFRK